MSGCVCVFMCGSEEEFPEVTVTLQFNTKQIRPNTINPKHNRDRQDLKTLLAFKCVVTVIK